MKTVTKNEVAKVTSYRIAPTKRALITFKHKRLADFLNSKVNAECEALKKDKKFMKEFTASAKKKKPSKKAAPKKSLKMNANKKIKAKKSQRSPKTKAPKKK